jgi:hypothetical protein
MGFGFFIIGSSLYKFDPIKNALEICGLPSRFFGQIPQNAPSNGGTYPCFVTGEFEYSPGPAPNPMRIMHTTVYLVCKTKIDPFLTFPNPISLNMSTTYFFVRIRDDLGVVIKTNASSAPALPSIVGSIRLDKNFTKLAGSFLILRTEAPEYNEYKVVNLSAIDGDYCQSLCNFI